jgi:hypothetical protein
MNFKDVKNIDELINKKSSKEDNKKNNSDIYFKIRDQVDSIFMKHRYFSDIGSGLDGFEMGDCIDEITDYIINILKGAIQ